MNKSATANFVYNANIGKWNVYTKQNVFSPMTYSCTSYAITYGNFGMKGEWMEKFDFQEQLPAIFLKQKEQISSFLSAGFNDLHRRKVKIISSLN